jgi:hypothetical protein
MVMKIIPILLLFISSFAQGQNYIGLPKQSIVASLKKAGVSAKDTTVNKLNYLQFLDAGRLMTLYVQNDSIGFMQCEALLAEINKTIEVYNKQFDRQKTYVWLDYSHPTKEFIYEIRKNKDSFTTTISIAK